MSTIVNVPEEVAAQVRELVDSGAYPDTITAFREAFRALKAECQRQHLRELVAKADAELVRGEPDLWSEELNQRLLDEARALYRSEAKPDPDVCP